MSEDCLYLNIWIPAKRQALKPFSTIVWIHLGAYNRGSSTISLYNGRYLSFLGNVIERSAKRNSVKRGRDAVISVDRLKPAFIDTTDDSPNPLVDSTRHPVTPEASTNHYDPVRTSCQLQPPDMKTIISFLICLYSFHVIHGEEIVHTLTGSITGEKIKFLYNDVYAYLGIPYARPPIGDLRFREPQPILKRSGLLDSHNNAPICMQDPVFPEFDWVPRNRRYMSEDCLYLNIWVPAKKALSHPFTTMVWIHGGAYNTGSSNIPVHYGHVLASIGNVIAVSINYRLGSFGFMNLNDSRMPGNMAMLDQVVALQWVYNNIEYFGGNKKDITLFGHSAGSISVLNHFLSPLSKRIINRAILQSGSNYNSYFTLTPEMNEKTTKLIAMYAGCNNTYESKEHLIDCLLSQKADRIAAAERKFQADNDVLFTYSPEVDGRFLLEDPVSGIDSGAIHGTEVMIGHLETEGSPILLYYKPEFQRENYPKLTKSEAEYILSKFYLLNGTLLQSVVDKYFGKLSKWNYSGITTRTVEALSDGILVCSIVALAEKLWKYQNTVYYYNFNHSRLTAGYRKWQGVPHFEENYFVFGMPFMLPEQFTEEEKYFSYQIIQLWTSFAKTGKPFYEGMDEAWLPFDPIFRRTMNLAPGNNCLYREKAKDECRLWRYIYDIRNPFKQRVTA
ncbi:LOW QUALITY PROTEIN: cholinesterase-like [Centruroides vittatus]|uniref:LOW QUALITY PROTEIN: cholinesterase-like n=1 Tax=Centruroides vittatus TaxID=120091 RepID=UPI0035108360